MIGQKLKLQHKEDEDEGTEPAEKGDEGLWGANKRNYYDADDAEVHNGGGGCWW